MGPEWPQKWTTEKTFQITDCTTLSTGPKCLPRDHQIESVGPPLPRSARGALTHLVETNAYVPRSCFGSLSARSKTSPLSCMYVSYHQLAINPTVPPFVSRPKTSFSNTRSRDYNRVVDHRADTPPAHHRRAISPR